MSLSTKQTVWASVLGALAAGGAALVLHGVSQGGSKPATKQTGGPLGRPSNGKKPCRPCGR